MTANRLRQVLPRSVDITVVDDDDAMSISRGLLFVPFGLTDAGRPRPAPPARSCTTASTIVHADRRACRPCRQRGVTWPAGDAALRRARRRHRRDPDARGDRRARRAGMGRERLHLLHPRRRRCARAAPRVRFDARPDRRERRRHADQVPGRAAGVLLPRRLVLPRARRPRRRRAHLRDAARRRVHQAGRLTTLGGLLASKGIELVTEFNTGEVDGAGGRAGQLRRARGRRSTCRGRSRCTAAPRSSVARPDSATNSTSCPPTQHTLQSKAAPNIFVIGDATNVPASKAGSVTHFEGETLVENIRRFLAGEPLERRLRRARQLLHRDRLPQGAADRLQLRHRTAARATSRAGSACRC